MSGIRDTATITLNVNGTQAKQMMADIQQNIDATKQKIDALKKAPVLDEMALKRARKDLAKYEKQLSDMESATQGVQNALENLDKATPRQLEKSLRTLRKELKDCPRDTKEWEELTDKIKRVKEELQGISEEQAVKPTFWGNFIGFLNKWQTAIVGIVAGADDVVSLFRDAVDAFAEMDQEMANVRKFTGMTEAQVASLNEEMKKIDTRTSREELNRLAQEAGRLGKSSQEDVLGFVRAADKINVALDDLGDGATLTLSKLTGIFGDEKRYGTEQSLLKVGSVINELSQNCSASAPYLAEFASRMGGVGAQAGMTIQQIMGFGAVLDSNGQKVEASSTALSQIIVRMMQDPAKYAKVAGLEVKKFSKMIRDDANGALIMFLENLQKAGGLDVLSPMFADMDENGSRAIAALSTLATHIDEVKAQQEAANVAFKEGTSIDKEFDVQNNTVAAGLDKCKKVAQEIRVELGERLAPLMSHVLSSTSAMMRSILTLANFLIDHKASVITLAAAVATYNIAVNFSIIKTKAAAAATAAWSAVTKILSGLLPVLRLGVAAVTNTVQYFTNGLQVNHAMQQRWRASMAAMKFANWTGLILAAVTAIALFTQKIIANRKALEEARKKAEEYRKDISDISEAAAEYSKKELARLKALYEAATDQKKSVEERKKAVEELQRIYPDYFKNMSVEEFRIGKAKDAYDSLTKSIIATARARAAAELIQENEKKWIILRMEGDKLKADRDKKKAEMDRAKALEASSVDGHNFEDPTSGFSNPASYDAARAENEYARADRALIQNAVKRREIERTNKKLAAQNGVDITKLNSDGADPVPEVPYEPGAGYTSQKQAEKERKKAEAAARREAAKAKKEFKNELNSYKAQRANADKEVLDLYRAGSIDYEEMLRRRFKNENDFYEKSITHFEKTFKDQKDTYLQDDKDYQNLLLAKSKAEEEYEAKRVNLALESIQRRKSEQEKAAQHEHDMKTDPSLKDEIALQKELYRIRREALDDQVQLYTVGSKEYADTKYQIEVLEQEKELEMKKLFFRSVNSLREKYDKKSASEQYQLEKAAMDALLKEGIITAEQYAKYLEKLTKSFKDELPGKAPENNKSKAKSALDKFKEDKSELDSALSNESIDDEEL